MRAGRASLRSIGGTAERREEERAERLRGRGRRGAPEAAAGCEAEGRARKAGQEEAAGCETVQAGEGGGRVARAGEGADDAGHRDRRWDDATVESGIAGNFTGWAGRAVRALENGQRWQIANGGSSTTPPWPSPKVQIGPASLGGFWLTIEGGRRG